MEGKTLFAVRDAVGNGALSISGVLKPPIMRYMPARTSTEYLSLLPPLRFPDLVTGEFPNFCGRAEKNGTRRRNGSTAHLDQGENIRRLRPSLPPRESASASSGAGSRVAGSVFYAIANRTPSISSCAKDITWSRSLGCAPGWNACRIWVFPTGTSPFVLARSAAKIVCLSLHEKRGTTDLEDFADRCSRFRRVSVSPEYIAFFRFALIADWELRHSEGNRKKKSCCTEDRSDYAMLFDLM
jgi:hypothetical protein